MTYEHPDPQEWTDSTGYDAADEPPEVDDVPDDVLGPEDPEDDQADLDV